MTVVKSFKPASLGNRSRSQGTGNKAELLFFEKAEDHGFEVMSPSYGSDTGIDFKVTSKTSSDPKKRRTYNVQVTSCSENGKDYYGDGTSPSWKVNKGIEHIRDDVDIIAILIHNYNSGEEKNINTGVAGKQDIWFIIPRDVFADPRMWKNYDKKTYNPSWYINISKGLLPPLDMAREAWALFRRPNINGQKSVEGFFAN
tara:strand:+ start:740 stop:1339 length:600 start_codon:yes stop_codon:yes gene_type:complete